MRDILWLRWFAVAAALTKIPYFLSQADTLCHQSSGRWCSRSLIFIKSCAIYLERRPVVLSEDEQKLYDMGFRSLRPREFVSLVVRGRNCLLGFRTVSLDSFVVMPNHLHGIIHGRGPNLLCPVLCNSLRLVQERLAMCIRLVAPCVPLVRSIGLRDT